jgi:hypothetical protein
MQQENAPGVRWEWIGEAWKLFTSAPATWIFMQLTAMALVFIAIVPIVIVFGGFGAIMVGGRFDASPLLLLMILVILLVMLLGGAYLTSGFYRTAIRQARGEAISVSDLFSGGDVFLSVLGYLILLSIAEAVIGLIIGIPSYIVEAFRPLTDIASRLVGVMVAGPLLFVIPQIVDGRAGVIESIRASVKLTQPYLLTYMLFAVVIALLGASGLIACLVGIFVTAPFGFTIPAVAYRDVFGLQGAQTYDQFMTPAQPPYYDAQPQVETPYSPAPPQGQPWSTPAYSSTPPQPPQSESTTHTCPHCGATLTRMLNFCNQCGRPLRSA